MLLLLILAYLGGVLTILSPCILPVLPFVFAREDRPFARNGLPMLAVRETLTDDHHRIRNLLGPLRQPGFVGREAEPSLRQLELIGSLHDSGATELPPDCDVPVSAAWRVHDLPPQCGSEPRCSPPQA